MSLTPGKARVDSVRASLRVLLFFVVRDVKKTAWRRHGAMVSCETLRLVQGARNRACRSKTHSADAGVGKRCPMMGWLHPKPKTGGLCGPNPMPSWSFFGSGATGLRMQHVGVEQLHGLDADRLGFSAQSADFSPQTGSSALA